MTYKKYPFALLARVVILFGFLTVLAFSVSLYNPYFIAASALFSLVSLYRLYRFIGRRFVEMDDFFEAVKYRDFSRWYSEKTGPKDLRSLHFGFNEVNRTIQEINKKKEAQYLYLQKILEMIDTGITAYNIETGDVLWVNESFKNTLDLPAFKNIRFVAKRKPLLFEEIFEARHERENSVSINVNNNSLKVLISESVFQIADDRFKLIVLQNIDDTLNQNESDAWKKLLSVMTHEIMNSIAPISSLAETLQNNIRLSMEHPARDLLDMNDLDTGIESIKRRSEGLLKFAKTYRSLNKVTQLNVSKVAVSELFENIQNLMKPSLENKNIELIFSSETVGLQVEIDTYLIEQVLINLMLNAVEACEGVVGPKILIAAQKNSGGHILIKVSDNGRGIPEEIMENIFVPFFSTKKNGSGIGLSLCKQIILLHKGKIQVNSKVGKGTAVSLVF